MRQTKAPKIIVKYPALPCLVPVYEREIIDTNPSFEDTLKDLRERRSDVRSRGRGKKINRFKKTET